jgi:hypothetical protein
MKPFGYAPFPKLKPGFYFRPAVIIAIALQLVYMLGNRYSGWRIASSAKIENAHTSSSRSLTICVHIGRRAGLTNAAEPDKAFLAEIFLRRT